ncbi:conserved hypothetical protein [Desulfarculus baarsii DSM 2075]|uniref:DUF3786 domain-containing protein n=1 Tax=Desulfarculus baarsii (strain ATCC 33931 / DSM 2075 / LMG 7858 / VKM B-1802 / 2st14) TaxID=644282 RepID=E1QDD9_DESB2|nr:DUF3786 domain-containing protein [Desulfarculus baarsii]ADK83458.1 conserved hypothetical protein [Desulfarculus baarsii DSM 2075]
MFTSDKPTNYEKVYQELIPRLAAADLAGNAAALGLERQGEDVIAPVFGRRFIVGAAGVRQADGQPGGMIHRIALAYYLTHGGNGQPAGRFAPYRELPGGADFARSLGQIVDARIAQSFSGRTATLEAACLALGGRGLAGQEISCDVGHVFEALPKIPMMLTFYDADDEFPAEAKVFYDAAAPNFLDLECLASLGMILALELERAAEALG